MSNLTEENMRKVMEEVDDKSSKESFKRYMRKGITMLAILASCVFVMLLVWFYPMSTTYLEVTVNSFEGNMLSSKDYTIDKAYTVNGDKIPKYDFQFDKVIGSSPQINKVGEKSYLEMNIGFGKAVYFFPVTKEQFENKVKDWTIVYDSEAQVLDSTSEELVSMEDLLNSKEYLTYMAMNAYVMEKEDFLVYMDVLSQRVTSEGGILSEEELTEEQMKTQIASKASLSYGDMYRLDMNMKRKFFSNEEGWNDSVFTFLESAMPN